MTDVYNCQTMQINEAPELNNNNLFPKSDEKNITLGGCEDLFALIDDADFDNMRDTSDVSLDDVDWKHCSDCNVKIHPNGSIYNCPMCGRTESVIDYNEEYSQSVADQYNTKKSGSAALRVVGNDSYVYARALIANTSVDYTATQKKETTKQLHRHNSQSNHKFPIIVLKETTEMYGQIQQEVVRRGNGRLGALASCLDFVCQKKGITKKPKVIAEFMQIEESDLSRGDKLLRDLHAENKINIPIYHDPLPDYINQYFEKLDIDQKYKPFVHELITTASDETKCSPNNAQPSTKCAGAIYTLVVQMGLDFDKNKISKECIISKSTFIRYYDFLVKNRKTLNEVFKKHKIPKLRSKKNRVKKTKPKQKNDDTKNPKKQETFTLTLV